MIDEFSLEKSILSTLACYDVLGGYPLTAFEIYKYLVSYSGQLSLNELLTFLAGNRRLKELVSRQNGFYFLKNKENLVQKRIERQKVSDQKWKKLNKIVPWLRIVPFIKAAAVSGSLAIGNARLESDWDLFIIAQHGRIWTVRVLLIALTQLMGQRRHGQIVKDRICLNWFITDQSLRLGLENTHTAHLVAQLTPLWGQGEFGRFFKINHWARKHLPFLIVKKNNLRKIKPNRFCRALAGLLEKIFNPEIVEKKLKEWQKNKIIRKIPSECLSFSLSEMKKNTQAHLCLSDKALILHYPVSRNLQIRGLYAQKIKGLLKNCG